MRGSASPPETSLTMPAPAARAARAGAALLVSMLTGTPRSTSAATTGSTRACSPSVGMGSAPGREDSPPTSTQSAPCSTSRSAASTALAASAWRPPSLNESGVTLRMPKMRGRSVIGDPGGRPEERHGLGSAGGVGEHAAGRERHGVGPGRAGAAGPEAPVRRRHEHEHAASAEALLDGGGDLLGEPLLQLRAGGERLDGARDAAEAGDAVRGE